MKNKFSLFSFYLFLSLIVISTAKSKKKKIKRENNQTTLDNGLPIPESVRPNYVLPELFCETCRAIVNEALKELRTKTKESDVYDYLSKACDESRYTTYEFIPKDIKKTCGIFMGIYEDEIVKLLTKRKIDAKSKEIIYQFCDEYTQVCKGVEVNYEKTFQKIEKNGNIDGMPITIDIHSNDEKSEQNKKLGKKTNKNKIKGKSRMQQLKNNKTETDL